MNDKLPKLPGQQPPQIDAAKTGWTLSWRIKGMALGLAISLIYFHFFTNDYNEKIIIACAILGYFIGWAAGSFMYTDKSQK